MKSAEFRDSAITIIHDSTERWIITTCYSLSSWSFFFKIEKHSKKFTLEILHAKWVMKKLEELISSNNSSNNNDNDNSMMLRAL
jgi:hypothetical protein